MVFATQRSVLGLLALSLLSTITTALLTAPDSPCASLCLNASNPRARLNRPDEIVCANKDYASETGKKFMGCIGCLQNSTYTSGSQNDQAWFMYNLQYAYAHCVFGYDGTGIGPYPCMTSEACGPLKTTVSSNLGNYTGNDPYAYCRYRGGSALGETFGKCLDCMKPDTKHGYLANFFVALEAGCEQRPGAHSYVSLNDTLFANRTIGIVDPNKPPEPSRSGLSTGALIAVIIVSVLLGIGLLGACVFLHLRRRRRNNCYNQSALEHDAALHMRGGGGGSRHRDRLVITGPSSGMRNIRNSVHNLFTPGPSRFAAAAAAASNAKNNGSSSSDHFDPEAVTWNDPGHLVELRNTAAEEKAALAAAALAQEEQQAHGRVADALHSHPPIITTTTGGGGHGSGAVRNFSHKQKRQQNSLDTENAAAHPETAVAASPYRSPDSYTSPSSATSATPFLAEAQGGTALAAPPVPAPSPSSYSPSSSAAAAALMRQQSWDETRAQARGVVADLLRPKSSKTDVKAPVASRQLNTTTFAPPPKR